MAKGVILPQAWTTLFDPFTGEKLIGGLIEFLESDAVDAPLKTVYMDAAQTQPYANPYMISSDVAAVPLFYGTGIYYIKIYAAPIAGCECEYNDAPPIYSYWEDLTGEGGGGSGGSGTNNSNLLPSFGFDSQVFPDIYSEKPIPNGINYFSFGFGWRNQTTSNTELKTYEFEPLLDSGYVGNPKNKVILKSTGSSGGNTICQVEVNIGFYNSFQNEKLAFSIGTQLISGSVNSLPIKIERTKNGTAQPSISVGSIPVSASGSPNQETISFTVPALSESDTGYMNSDILKLIIELPLNTDFEIGLTGSWLQHSEDGTVNITENSAQVSAIKQILGSAAPYIQNNDDSKRAGFPLCVSDGYSDVFVNTGIIFKAPTATETYYRFCTNLKTKKEFLANNVYQNCPTNRIISLLQNSADSNLRRSENTFVFPAKTATTLDISTGLATAPHSTWQSFGSKITITKETPEFEMKISASQFYDYNTINSSLITFTWQTNGVVNPGFYNPLNETGNPIFAGGSFEGSSLSLTSYLGYFSHIENNGGGAPPGQASDATFKQYLRLDSSTNGSATTKAVCWLDFGYFNFRNANIIPQTQGAISGFEIDTAITMYSANFLKSSNMQYQYNTDPSELRDYKTGFLTWNDVGETYNTTSNVQKYILGFDVDEDGAPNVPAAISGGIRKIVSVSSIEDIQKNTIVRKIVDAINNSFVYRLTFSATLPVSGDTDKSYISNKDTDFVLIPWNKTTDPNKPENQDTDKIPIYIEFESTTTIPQLIDVYENSIKLAVAGMPSPQEMGLPATDNIDYFMHL